CRGTSPSSLWPPSRPPSAASSRREATGSSAAPFTQRSFRRTTARCFWARARWASWWCWETARSTWGWCSGRSGRRSLPSRARGARETRSPPRPRRCSASFRREAASVRRPSRGRQCQAADVRRPSAAVPGAANRSRRPLLCLLLSEARARLLGGERRGHLFHVLGPLPRLGEDLADGDGRLLGKEPDHAHGRPLAEDGEQNGLIVHRGDMKALLGA